MVTPRPPANIGVAEESHPRIRVLRNHNCADRLHGIDPHYVCLGELVGLGVSAQREYEGHQPLSAPQLPGPVHGRFRSLVLPRRDIQLRAVDLPEYLDDHHGCTPDRGLVAIPTDSAPGH